MDKKNYALVFQINELVYRLCPANPLQNEDKKWYYHCITDRSQKRIYSIPDEKGLLNNKKLSVGERIEYAHKIAEHYNSLLPPKNKEIADCLLVTRLPPPCTERLKTKLIERTPELRPKTVKGYESQIKILEKYCAKNNITEINTTSLQTFLNHLKAIGLNNSTVNSYRSMISALSEKEDKKILDEIANLKKYPDGAMYFTRPEIIRLHDEIKSNYPQLWLACMFVFYCFIRPRAELLQLKISDLNLYDHTITLSSSFSKNKKTETIVIPRPMMELLDEWQLAKYPASYYIIGSDGIPSETPMPTNKLGTLHQKIIKSLGFNTRKYKMYSWKNTGLIEAIKNGIDIVSLQRQVRHHSLDQLNEYLTKVGAIHCATLHTHFPSIDQLRPQSSVLNGYVDDMLKLLKNAKRTDINANDRYQLALVEAEIKRIIG